MTITLEDAIANAQRGSHPEQPRDRTYALRVAATVLEMGGEPDLAYLLADIADEDDALTRQWGKTKARNP